MSDILDNDPVGSIELQVDEAEAGSRLDKLLAQRIASLSRARIQALIRDGKISGPGGATIGDASYRVKPGETYIVTVPEAEPAKPEPEHIALTVVHEDADVIVIDKPSHLVVHPGPGHSGGTLVNALIAHCGASLSGIGGIKRPGIVHRLDKGTSGLLVVAKNDAAHKSLSEQFASHGADGRLTRTYLALVWGKPLRPRGVISARLARSHTNRTKITVTASESGRHAVTHYEVVETIETSAGPVSLLQLELETGRTHQIRVHLAHIGHPVLADATYASGFKAKGSKLGEGARAALAGLHRQALHAAELGFVHPRTGKPLHFLSPLPPDIAALLDALRRD
ncbi:MAG: RluA family pseudouridine synthase [Hyphomicrobium sp.]|jgi:23S rRNA pseudouridine1911/1915/1917 synthase